MLAVTSAECRASFLVLVLVACGGAPSAPRAPTAAPSAPAAPRHETRLWRLRDQVLRAPEDLAFDQRTACLAEEDPRFEGLFVGGQTQILTLRSSVSRIEAWMSCEAPILVGVFIYPRDAEDLRYFVSYVEAGVAIDVRVEGVWARACNERTCKPGQLAEPDQAFWEAQWENVSLVDDLSTDAMALEAAILARVKSSAR